MNTISMKLTTLMLMIMNSFLMFISITKEWHIFTFASALSYLAITIIILSIYLERQ